MFSLFKTMTWAENAVSSLLHPLFLGVFASPQYICTDLVCFLFHYCLYNLLLRKNAMIFVLLVPSSFIKLKVLYCISYLLYNNSSSIKSAPSETELVSILSSRWHPWVACLIVLINIDPAGGPGLWKNTSHQTERRGVTHGAQRSGCNSPVFVDKKPH